MSKYKIIDLWNEWYGKTEEISDYAGRIIKKSACGNHNSNYEPTIDHIRPLSDGGQDVKENIVICHYETNYEKADKFPHWKANGKRFHAVRVKGTKKYKIFND
jgi:5-methylcytosine-specific restriction endonuclease McrA